MLSYIILTAVAAVSVGSAASYYILKKKKPSEPSEARDDVETEPDTTQRPTREAVSVPEKISPDAEAKAREIILEAKDEAIKIKKSAEEEARKTREEVFETERRLAKKEESLDQRIQNTERKEEDLINKQKEASRRIEDLENIRKQQVQKLEKVAGLTRDQAKKQLLSNLEKLLKDDIAKRIKEAEEKIEAESDKRVKDILVSAIQRSATDYVSEHTTSRIKLPDEEMKGRIIGREGRNIKALEKATGVDFDLDETPGEVRLSCFDPVRREIARIALERLVADGRIQPARIEEFVQKAQKDIEKEMRKAGEQLAYDAGVPHLPSGIIDLLGRFKFRTSYGQNLVQHTLEVVRVGKIIAEELGVDVDLVKKACLLHDIGKTQTADMEGPHAELTRRILEKFRFDEKLVNAAAAHHEEEEFKSVEAVIVHISDSVSGSRPGARLEDYEAFMKRMRQLEDAAKTFEGVANAYAISAGREVRVIVEPTTVDDAASTKLAHDIAHKIEKEQTYPGQVKVTVVRELRASGVAK